MTEDSFLKDSWEHHVEEGERGKVSPAEKAMDAYFIIQEQLLTDPKLATFRDQLEREIREYASAVARHKVSRETSAPKDEIQSFDHHRRLVHDSLISTLQAISRNVYQRKLDNSWVNVVGLKSEDREAIGAWALDVARTVFRKEGERGADESG